MDRAQFRRALQEIEWSELEGAYGGSEHVEAALWALSDLDDVEDDEWSEAMDVLTSHVWHQGTIYPVTPLALSLVLTLVHARQGPAHEALAEYASVVVGSALYCADSSDKTLRVLARQVFSVVDHHHGWMGRYISGPSARWIANIALATPSARLPYLEALRVVSEIDETLWLVLAKIAEPPAWLAARAQQALNCEDVVTRSAVASIVASNERTKVQPRYDRLRSAQRRKTQ